MREGRGSVSLLQRTLGIGYGRAARLIDFMAEDGIVGEYNGSQAREVVISAGGLGSDAGRRADRGTELPRPKPERSNVVLPDPEASYHDPGERMADAQATAARATTTRQRKVTLVPNDGPRLRCG